MFTVLKKLRNKKTAKKVWIILAILVVPAFVLWGSGSLIRSKQEPTYAGKIFGRRISFLEYKDAMDAAKNSAIMQFGDNFSEIKKYLNLEAQAWDRLILLGEAKNRRIRASDKEVIELIQSYPVFQRRGQFVNKQYSEILQYVFRASPRNFEEQTRQNLMLSKLYKQVTDSVNLADKEIREEYQKLNAEVSLYYIAAVPSDFTNGLNPGEEEVKDYFAKNSLNFKLPVSFNMNYIVLESEDKIKEASLDINKNADLTKIAKGLGLAVKETGFFSPTDPIPGIGWSPEILNLISKLQIGQFTPPIKADKYYYVFQLKERKESYIPDFEKVKDKVKEALIKDESEKIAKEKIEESLKELKEQYRQNPKLADLNKAAKEHGLKYDSTALFKYGSYIEGIGASDSFWLAAEKLKKDESSDIITMPSGFYIVKIKNRVNVDEKKFESEKEEFRQKGVSQKKQ